MNAGHLKLVGPERSAVVGSQQLSVLLEGQENVTLAVQSPADVNGGAIGAG